MVVTFTEIRNTRRGEAGLSERFEDEFSLGHIQFEVPMCIQVKYIWQAIGYRSKNQGLKWRSDWRLSV